MWERRWAAERYVCETLTNIGDTGSFLCEWFLLCYWKREKEKKKKKERKEAIEWTLSNGKLYWSLITIGKEPIFSLMLLHSALPGFMSCIELWDCTFTLLGFPCKILVYFSFKSQNCQPHLMKLASSVSMSRYIAFHLTIYIYVKFWCNQKSSKSD